MRLHARVSVAVVAENAGPLNAGDCAAGGDRNVLKRQRRKRLAEAAEDLVFESFNIDLAELRLAMAGDEFVKTDQRHADHAVPPNPLKPSIGLHIVPPGVGKGRDRRGTPTQVELSLAWLSGDSTSLDGDAGVAAVEQPQQCNEVRLRLDRDDASANPAENAYSIAYVCADVESQITGLKKLPVEGFHLAAAPDWAVIGNERTGDSGSAADHVSAEHPEIRIGWRIDFDPQVVPFASLLTFRIVPIGHLRLCSDTFISPIKHDETPLVGLLVWALTPSCNEDGADEWSA
jgi:hypothetical protein